LRKNEWFPKLADSFRQVQTANVKPKLPSQHIEKMFDMISRLSDRVGD
jgi:hypothetical protein